MALESVTMTPGYCSTGYRPCLSVSSSQGSARSCEYGARAQLAPRYGAQQLSPHDLRRTCARNAYDNGANLLLVQAALGHTDPKTTAHYIGTFDQDDHTAIDYVRY